MSMIPKWPAITVLCAAATVWSSSSAAFCFLDKWKRNHTQSWYRPYYSEPAVDRYRYSPYFSPMAGTVLLPVENTEEIVPVAPVQLPDQHIFR